MSADGLALNSTAPSAAVAAVLETLTAHALETGGTVSDASVVAATRILTDAVLDPAACDRALALLGAALYLSQSRLSGSAIDACQALAVRPDAPARAAAAAARLLALDVLVFRGPGAVAALLAALATDGLEPAVAAVIRDGLREVAAWAPDLLLIEDLAAAVEGVRSPDVLEEMLCDVIEPVMLAMPERVDVTTFERLSTALGQMSSWRWTLAYLSERTGAPAAAGLDRSLQASARRQLGRPGARALVVQNIADGQGDEIVRVIPLVQAFLAFNPSLEVVVVTSRAYLYAHPRVHTVPIDDPDAVRHALALSFTAMLVFYEPNVPEINHDGELMFLVEHAARARPPYLRVSADKGWNQFTFQRVEVALLDRAAELGLDHPRATSVYDPAFRLLAVLGIPIRLGTETPSEPPVLAGRAWPDAERAWRGLVGDLDPGRPVALVNPFGGGEPLKGYVDATLPRAARRLEALVDEGFAAVILPNGTAWGDARQARALRSLVDRRRRVHIGIAPDPGARHDSMQLGSDGPTAPYASYRMRLATYFVRRADLVVTVEGWMMHAAYLLGRPYRLLLTAHGHGPEWWPHGRSSEQSVAVEPRSSAIDVADPPLPDQPRKQALIFTLRQLASARSPATLPFVRRALRSQDRDIRVAATEALGAVPEPALVDELRPLLHDAAAPVRAAASRALMARPNRPADTDIAELLAHVWLAEVPPVWGNVVGLGPAGRSAVAHAAQGDDPVLRREAGRILAQTP